MLCWWVTYTIKFQKSEQANKIYLLYKSKHEQDLNATLAVQQLCGFPPLLPWQPEFVTITNWLTFLSSLFSLCWVMPCFIYPSHSVFPCSSFYILFSGDLLDGNTKLQNSKIRKIVISPFKLSDCSLTPSYFCMPVLPPPQTGHQLSWHMKSYFWELIL